MKTTGYLIIPHVQELNCSHDVQGYLNAAAKQRKSFVAQVTLPQIMQRSFFGKLTNKIAATPGIVWKSICVQRLNVWMSNKRKCLDAKKKKEC
jgi:hypothetical protein